ncbi:class I SAM-dependent methyltransferase [Pigmentibacter ruber]
MYIDERTVEIFKLLDSLNFESSFNFDKVLDIGVGNCEIAKYFSNRKFTVTGIGLELKSYIDDFEILQSQYNISLIECSIERMPFEDESFDLIIMSYVMEHCPNIGLALKEVKRVLKKKGKVLLFVPPHSDFICSGHIAMGWNVGQLMYTLLVNGFDVKHNSSFITQNYSIAAYVSKLEIDLPKLRGDKGDIHNLFLANFFPFEVMRKYDSLFDGFDGKNFIYKLAQ